MDTVDVALADRALSAGWGRHTPVACNHSPFAVHGTRTWHVYASGETLESVAVLYPPEDEDDPCAGLWWVLVE